MTEVLFDTETITHLTVLDTQDLNTVIVTGTYIQPLTAGATAALHYPLSSAGLIEVDSSTAGSGFVYQRYTSYFNAANRVFVRCRYNGAWGGWIELVRQGADLTAGTLTAGAVTAGAVTAAGLTSSNPVRINTTAALNATGSTTTHGLEIRNGTDATATFRILVGDDQIDAFNAAGPRTLYLNQNSGGDVSLAPGGGKTVVRALYITVPGDAPATDAGAVGLLIGDVTSTNLQIDNNEIQALNNGAGSSLGINTDPGGNVNLGAASNTVSVGGTLNATGMANLKGGVTTTTVVASGTLAVKGTTTLGDDVTVKGTLNAARMLNAQASGSVSVAVSGSGTTWTGSANVTFPSGRFTTTPTFVCSSWTSVPASVSVGFESPTTTSAKINIARTSNTSTTVHWIAMGN